MLLRHDVYIGLLAGRPGIRDVLDSTDQAGGVDFDFDPAALYIAAITVLVQWHTVVTRNVADFAPTGVAMRSRWDAA